MRAARYVSVERREALEGALANLDAFRAGSLTALTLEDAERLVRPPADEAAPNPPPEPDTNETPGVPPEDRGVDLHGEELDALRNGRSQDLEKIGEALDRAWEEFYQTKDRLAATAETSRGAISIDVPVDAKLLDWVSAFNNPATLELADQQHERVLDLAPYHLDLTALNCDSLESAIRTVAGTARSMGLDVIG